MTRTILIAGLIMATAGAAGARLRVVTTVPDLAALTAEVGGDHVAVQSLSLETQDPHFVDPKPSAMLDLNKADLLIAIGAGLEVGWLPTLQKGARNAAILPGGAGFLDCSRAVALLEVSGGKVDRSQGDIHAEGNPHYLYDPRRALKCAAAIRDALARLDAEHAADYRRSYDAFAEKLAARMKTWEAALAHDRGVPVLAYHRSFPYLADWLGLEIVEHLEPKPGIPPTPSHVLSVIKLGKARTVRMLVQEDFLPTKTGKLVAGKLGIAIVQLPAGTRFRAGQSYLEHMDEVVKKLEAGLHD